VQFNTQVSALFHIASSKDPPQMPEEVSDDCREFLLQTFNRDPKRRPNASKLLQHGYLVRLRSLLGHFSLTFD